MFKSFFSKFINFEDIAVVTTEADKAIASSDFLKIKGISNEKGANRGDSGQFCSLRLISF